MKEVVNVLWTGGLDSTCRIVELSVLDIIVQPYYIVDAGRKSYTFELRAMDKIRKKILSNPLTKAELNEVILIDKIEENFEIKQAWQSLHEKYGIGSQYAFIASFAKKNNLILEVGLEKSERSKAANAILSEAHLESLVSSSGVEEYYLANNSSNLIKTIFGNIRIPKVLFNISKLEEVEEMKKMGYNDVILDTWFCHTPVLGLPCGHCNPCKDALNEGLAFRVPLKGRILGTFAYFFRRVNSKILECIKRLH